MRWQGQTLAEADEGVLPGLSVRVPGLVRVTTTPRFAGVRFHEVLAKSVLNKAPDGSIVPFRWTINPFRGCLMSCAYCFARSTHSYLGFGSGEEWQREIVVKVNAPEVLRRELARKSWAREHVALGTNTDPYQRAEGRYQLMPGILGALADSGTPLSVLTKGTLLQRDIPLLRSIAAQVPVGLGVSLAIYDEPLQQLLEPGTPGIRARLNLVRALREADLPCGVFLAPVLPGLTDSEEHLDKAFAALAEAGATGVTVVPLHLRPGAREEVFGWLRRERPDLVPLYSRLYRRGAYLPDDYRAFLAARVAPLLERHGLAGSKSGGIRGVPGDDDASFPPGSMPEGVTSGAAEGLLAGRVPDGPEPAGDVPAGRRDRGPEQLALL